MLPIRRFGEGKPTAIFMPFTGGSWKEYVGVIELLKSKIECIGIDLPGYGDANDILGYRIEDLADSVSTTIASLDLGRFVLVGHSFSGRLAAVLARYAADGDSRLKTLEALVLVAPATSSPDPISHKVRSALLQMFEGEPSTDQLGRAKDRRTAENFIKMNVSRILPAAVLDSATEDVLRMNRDAWRSWYGEESQKDWSERVGLLQLPVLIVAGEKDPSVGPVVQEKHNMPHFPNGQLKILNANHLIPLEMPAELSKLIEDFVTTL